MKKIAVIGIGSYLYEDQLGWLVVDELQKMNISDEVLYFNSKGNSLDWLDAIKGVDHVIFVDAVYSDEKTGFIHSFPITSDFSDTAVWLANSSHNLSLISNIQLAVNIGDLTLPVQFIGGEIDQNAEDVSPQLLTSVVKTVLNDISTILASQVFPIASRN